jgi:hypothetical protein
MKCPVCKGSGEIQEPKKRARDKSAERRRIARILHATKLFSYRQIADAVGWKSPRSVMLAVKETRLSKKIPVRVDNGEVVDVSFEWTEKS